MKQPFSLYVLSSSVSALELSHLPPVAFAAWKTDMCSLNVEKVHETEDLLRRILSGKDPEVFLHANIVSETSDFVRQAMEV